MKFKYTVVIEFESDNITDNEEIENKIREELEWGGIADIRTCKVTITGESKDV